jgi:hypothetical protein
MTHVCLLKGEDSGNLFSQFSNINSQPHIVEKQAIVSTIFLTIEYCVEDFVNYLHELHESMKETRVKQGLVPSLLITGNGYSNKKTVLNLQNLFKYLCYTSQ